MSIFNKRQGRILGECIPPPSNFKNASHKYNFFIISNLFNNNNAYALSMHIENMRTNASYLVRHSELRANKQNLHENCSKTTKTAIALLQYVNNQKFSRGHVPGLPWSRFFSSICVKLILQEKIRFATDSQRTII